MLRLQLLTELPTMRQARLTTLCNFNDVFLTTSSILLLDFEILLTGWASDMEASFWKRWQTIFWPKLLWQREILRENFCRADIGVKTKRGTFLIIVWLALLSMSCWSFECRLRLTGTRVIAWVLHRSGLSDSSLRFTECCCYVYDEPTLLDQNLLKLLFCALAREIVLASPCQESTNSSF